jgi:adenine phosphoribosyltransferase
MADHEAYSIVIAGVHRMLYKFEAKKGLKIAFLASLGDTELIQASARELGVLLKPKGGDYLVTSESGGIALAHALSVVLGIPYVVLRKSYKPYMGETLKSETLSIATGALQTLFLDEKDRALINDKKVIIVDDVISTGSTLRGMQLIMQKANAHIIAEAAILTEGDKEQWAHIVALGHLPVWIV